ncbi:uncharacterized protein LOC143220491 [Lasioglossum baleicum]|uniref:uncharacterized protein LOC143220491 n=1 Tax=Lasioglossum baleicum TaxID=434251 RepID=UPI003FCD2BD1
MQRRTVKFTPVHQPRQRSHIERHKRCPTVDDRASGLKSRPEGVVPPDTRDNVRDVPLTTRRRASPQQGRRSNTVNKRNLNRTVDPSLTNLHNWHGLCSSLFVYRTAISDLESAVAFH